MRFYRILSQASSNFFKLKFAQVTLAQRPGRNLLRFSKVFRQRTGVQVNGGKTIKCLNEVELSTLFNDTPVLQIKETLGVGANALVTTFLIIFVFFIFYFVQPYLFDLLFLIQLVGARSGTQAKGFCHFDQEPVGLHSYVYLFWLFASVQHLKTSVTKCRREINSKIVAACHTFGQHGGTDFFF